MADRKPSARAVAGIVAAILALLAVTLAAAERIAAARAIDTVSRGARASAILLASSFRREIDKFQLVPVVLADDREAREALVTRSPKRLNALSRKLEALSGETGAAHVYLLDARGMTVAASNWRRRESFVGDSYAFRPYFRNAMRDGAAQHFALGQRTRQPGMFISKRLDRDGKPLGVFIVKVDFRGLERDWREAANTAFVTDRRGIILVTADPGSRFQTIRPLSDSQRADARRSLNYGTVPLVENALFAAGAVAPPGAADAHRARFIEAVEPVGGWRVHVLTPTRPAVGNAIAFARLAVAIAAMSGGALYLLWRYRRRRDARRIEAAANTRLTELRRQLVQANKLATLGQITAGVGHEINQPVAAIGAYAHNARTLLDRAQPDAAHEAIGHIVALTERIGRITRELRGFSRRSTGEIERVSLAEVFDGLRLLLRDRLVGLGADFATIGPACWVRGERVRLEQVMMNLVQNALDAGGRTVTATVTQADARVLIRVSDDGPGIDPAMRASLFQPFKTSKRDGLGLGLVISHDIVADLGGTLTVGDPPRGAEFVIDLERAP